MGAWGTGPFDNDDAGDWVYELEGSTDLDFVRRTIRDAVEADGYLELPEGANALAAAALIAASLDGNREGLSAPAAAWLDGATELATVRDARLALRGLDRVVAPDSEAAELWEESDGGREWSVMIGDLRRRLERGAA